MSLTTDPTLAGVQFILASFVADDRQPYVAADMPLEHQTRPWLVCMVKYVSIYCYHYA